MSKKYDNNLNEIKDTPVIKTFATNTTDIPYRKTNEEIDYEFFEAKQKKFMEEAIEKVFSEAENIKLKKENAKLTTENTVLKSFIIKYGEKTLGMSPFRICSDGIIVEMDKFIEYDRETAYKEVIDKLKKKAVKLKDGEITQYIFTDRELNKILKGRKKK